MIGLSRHERGQNPSIDGRGFVILSRGSAQPTGIPPLPCNPKSHTTALCQTDACSTAINLNAFKPPDPIDRDASRGVVTPTTPFRIHIDAGLANQRQPASMLCGWRGGGEAFFLF